MGKNIAKVIPDREYTHQQGFESAQPPRIERTRNHKHRYLDRESPKTDRAIDWDYRYLFSAIVSIILAIALVFPTFPTLANPHQDRTQVKATTVTVTGTIRKLAIEGTCYQLATDDGKKYELMGTFPRRDGVKVRVSGVIATDVVTICQVGQPFKVKSIRIINN
jgi:hypothetical protein